MQTPLPLSKWLPISKKELDSRGWDEVDIIIVSGDAYVDHPSFGHAVIARVLEHEGYKVAILPQPNWRDDLRDFKKLGKPRLFFGVTAGCMDSMVNHYTANKRLRSDDAYTPDGKSGFRPDYASVVYTRILKQLYPDTPVIIGGIEASMRRFAHYDYWSDTLKPSILIESGADALVYGMGEQAIIDLALKFSEGAPAYQLKSIPQTVWKINKSEIKSLGGKAIVLNSFDDCLKDKKSYADTFLEIEKQSIIKNPVTLVQQHAEDYILVNKPYPETTSADLDEVYDLPYTRMPHPRYHNRGAIPAYEMIRHSVNIHRGCFGGCAFCTISAHQGKFIISRSEKSILKEVEQITTMPDFKGYISDMGGPSANMYQMKGIDEKICEKCTRPSCIFPKLCSNLNANHRPMIELYRKAQKIKGIKKIFIGSGIRYDMLQIRDSEKAKKWGLQEYVNQVITHHVSGRLKVAPEHTSDEVLSLMRKPSFDSFKEFYDTFQKVCRQNGLNQQLIPYFISSHPGSTVQDMADLAVKTAEMGYRLEQVQDFTPTPMTLATVIYYTGINPYTGKTVFVAKSKEERSNQNILLFWYKPENRDIIKKILDKHRAGSAWEKLYVKKRSNNFK